MTATPEAVAIVAAFAEQCRQCYQCGQCVAGCPSGWELDHGPRRVVRLILAGEVDELLACEDVWRCSECGHCTESCPMEVDTAAAMALTRRLQRQHGGPRCPERAAADLAERHLRRRPRIDNLMLGAALVARGNMPRDLRGSAAQGAASAHSTAARAGARLLNVTGAGRRWPALERYVDPGSTDRPSDATNTDEARPFFAGCALPQDPHVYQVTKNVAADLGLRLDERTDAGCCGHPARGTHSAGYRIDGVALTACPACDAGLQESGQATQPLWEVLVERARARGLQLTAAAPAFVPYVGCLGDRERALQGLEAAAELAGVQVRRSYPSLHASCCGALGSMFRGDTHASRRLLGFAAEVGAPVVTTCLLCRDNLRSAARRNRLAVPVYFWPEFFRAAERTETP